MKSISTKYILVLVLGMAIAILIFSQGCVSEKVAAKSGSQLWAENCQHCHNTPSPNSFSADQWVTIGMHMQTRALITEQERDKIVDFLKQSTQ
jgi:cytochrome c2